MIWLERVKRKTSQRAPDGSFAATKPFILHHFEFLVGFLIGQDGENRRLSRDE